MTGSAKQSILSLLGEMDCFLLRPAGFGGRRRRKGFSQSRHGRMRPYAKEATGFAASR
jgi:hypothetical protein